MPRKKTFVDNQFEGHPLCNVPREFSYNYIRTIVDLVSTMTERHSKVLVARFDLRYPQGYEAEGSNRDFSTTMQAVCRDFSQKNMIRNMSPEENSRTAEIRIIMWGLFLTATKNVPSTMSELRLKNIGRNSCKFHCPRFRKKLWFIHATERRMVLIVPMAG